MQEEEKIFNKKQKESLNRNDGLVSLMLPHLNFGVIWASAVWVYHKKSPELSSCMAYPAFELTKSSVMSCSTLHLYPQ